MDDKTHAELTMNRPVASHAGPTPRSGANLFPLFSDMFQRLLGASGQSRTARTVELFGWLIFFEGPLMLLAPHLVAGWLHLPPLEPQAANYFRLLGVLVGGIGMLYIVSGRLDSEGFAFASLLDRPLVPFVMFVLWRCDIVPGALALIFSLQDAGSFVWTLLTWRSERMPARPLPTAKSS